VPDDFPKIQLAINNASPGDTILVANGTFGEQLVINKTINLIGSGINQTILDGNNMGTAIRITTDNITVKGFTIQRFTTGIVINQTENILIVENRITEIWTKGATYILNSRNITLNKNTIINNESPGINIQNSNATQFSQNTVAFNVGIGITATNCRNFTAIDNQIESNLGDAIYCSNVYNFYIIENTFALNDYRGIWATYSNGTAYHNNFIRNRENARSIMSNITWDNGYPSGGNYWSNYTGNDIYYGVDQNVIGSDGVGDAPFTLPQEGEQDRYPLMGNYTEQTTTLNSQNYTISFVSNSVITNLYVNQTDKSLYFTINNPAKPSGFAQVVIPKSLMWCQNIGEWAVRVDGNLTNRTIIEDDNYTYFYFATIQGIHQTKITSTNIVPEISTSALILLVICILLIAIYSKQNSTSQNQTRLHKIWHPQIKTNPKNLAIID